MTMVPEDSFRTGNRFLLAEASQGLCRPPPPTPAEPRPKLVHADADVTDDLLNAFVDLSVTNYTFEDDLREEHDFGNFGLAGRGASISRKGAYEFCTDFVVNSSVAVECGKYFDRNIMNAIDICMRGENHSTIMYILWWQKSFVPSLTLT